jgi:hypothetical protein
VPLQDGYHLPQNHLQPLTTDVVHDLPDLEWFFNEAIGSGSVLVLIAIHKRLESRRDSI